MSMVVVAAGECGTRATLALPEAGHAGPGTLLDSERLGPCERPPLSEAAILAAMPAASPIAGAEALAAAGIGFGPGRQACATGGSTKGNEMRERPW